MSLFSALANLIKPAPPPDPEVAAALDRVIGMVDPLVRAAPQLEKHLLGAVEHALAYCAGLVDALPGPVDINRQAFAQDPQWVSTAVTMSSARSPHTWAACAGVQGRTTSHKASKPLVWAAM